MYWYYELRGDKTYSQRLLTSDVLNVLNNMAALEEDEDGNEDVVLREKIS